MNTNNETILVVEDDKYIREFICHELETEGFAHKAAVNASAALDILLSETYTPVDLVLLDLGLPDLDGMDVIKTLREQSDIPIIVVSARDQDREKAEALDAGADDYLTKPFSEIELMARIRVALRHAKKPGDSAVCTCVIVGALKMDFEKRLCYLDDTVVHLTPREYSLLSLLFNNIGKVLTTRYIISEIWGPGYGNDTQALRAHMAGLRRKIEENPAKPRYLLTEIGIGYRLAGE